MKIECILRRDPPTTVILGVTAYQFQPDEDGRHVCDVEDPAHLARLLSISEAYRLPGDAPVPEELKPAIIEQTLPEAPTLLVPIDEYAIKGSDVHPRTFDLGGAERVHLDDVLVHALDLSGLTTYEWNRLPDEDRHNFIDIALDDLDERELPDETAPAPAPVPEAKPTPETAPVSDVGNSSGGASSSAPDATDVELEALRDQFVAKFGKKPHHKFGAEKLRTLLADEVPDNEE